MKEKNFEIKIADLLNHLGSDTIEFSEMKTPLLPHLTEKGISGMLKLYAVDGKSILVHLEEGKASLSDTCEICGKAFIRSLHIDRYEAKFTLDAKELEESNEEVLFLIEAKNATINVEEMLYQAVMLQTPFVIACEKCEKRTLTDDEV
ncbi:MAG: hypothetical protein LBG59_09885 [Candidatus Peribacteria bacterium]|jgi:uncharacterized metal-binding protein YceD (DUF177 family)|nr:hypothetical protein [Candidatus Peribacteria bacterium]